MKTFSWFLLVFLILFLTACAPTPGATQGPSAVPATVTPAPNPGAPQIPTDPATASTANTASPTSATRASAPPSQPAAGTAPAGMQKMLGDQLVQINAQELMTVSTASFNLTGQAPAGSVVSVNNDFIVIGANRGFSFPINLEEGPNLVEVVASNDQGQQVSVEIVVVYDPTP